MAIIDDNNQDRKEARKQRRAERQRQKDIKLGEQISTEAKGYGIDIDKPKPLSTSRKAEIDQLISEGVKEDIRGGLQRFQKLYKEPQIESPTLDKERLKRLARREKRARIGDIISALGKGLQGKTVDPSQFTSSKLQKERQSLYEQYKGASRQAKQRMAEWEDKYRKDQLDYLDAKLKDKKTSEKEKLKIQQMKADIERTQALTQKAKTEEQWIKGKPYSTSTAASKAKPSYTYQTKEGNWMLTNQKNPYSDLYYKLTGNSPIIINELAKIAGHAVDEQGNLKRNLSSDEIERFSNTLLSKAYDITVDEKGNRVAVPKRGREQFLKDIASSIDKTNTLKEQISDLEKERDQKIYNAEGSFFGKSKETLQQEINDEYTPMIEEIRSNLKQSESDLNKMLSGGSLVQSTPETKEEDLEDIWNS